MVQWVTKVLCVAACVLQCSLCDDLHYRSLLQNIVSFIGLFCVLWAPFL